MQSIWPDAALPHYKYAFIPINLGEAIALFQQDTHPLQATVLFSETSQINGQDLSISRLLQ